MNRTSAERPAKRVRQACEPCRRKKAKCPGEQPVCSLCARLNQRCAYAEERPRSLTGSFGHSGEPVPVTGSSENNISEILDGRLGSLEMKIGEVLDALGQGALRNSQPPAVAATPPIPAAFRNPMMSTSLAPLTPLPSWEKVTSIAQLYLLYCDSQPLPLFYRDDFLSSLGSRDPELVYAILALSIRFAEDQYQDINELMVRINGYTEVARSLVMKRVSEGPVELSTLQSLCLLSIIDFTNGNTHRSSIHSSLAMNLALCANLGSETTAALNPRIREERRRCFWSICLLKRLHGVEFDNFDFPDGRCPPYPQSPDLPQRPCSPHEAARDARSSDLKDQGILAYVIMLSEVFSKTAKYVRNHGKPSNVPPWSSQSEYSKIITLQMELETRMPLQHRFKPANLNERTPEELTRDRALRNFRSTIPEIFLQHTSDLISSHTTWIIHFINYFEEKSFMVSDPLLGYSAAVVATIELQLSFTEDEAVRQDKRDRFFKCVEFVQNLGQKWPHMARLAERLHKLEDAVSATYRPNSGAQNKCLLIDLSRFWEILEYSSNSDSDSARRMFGDSLYSEPPPFNAEVSQTSPLPEPTRLNSQQGLSHSPMTRYGLTPVMSGLRSVDPMASPRTPDLLNDEFSILAANFFSQGQEFLRGGDNREGFGF
ncbi:hypothetical protein FE257_005458 [Aspergillus nanangensis]|uniref:Zn(2)-C6 fungal-type domain-containing protein n=1 Tax=Aspergillus nanangensis TaxID=2582783 RepID=A0AAD4CSG1_ASPNN|nr:hypothetical protein FE257_005458 [Aspergillus nanangensis]